MTLEETQLHLKVDGWCVIEEVIPEDKVDRRRRVSKAEAKAWGTDRG